MKRTLAILLILCVASFYATIYIEASATTLLAKIEARTALIN